ncbi:outer membrane protein assembly factor BamA [candidate division TA06 bacterium]|nr:outer membrane protein assembly factor BamA [candidate division TA06 bacterium]
MENDKFQMTNRKKPGTEGGNHRFRQLVAPFFPLLFFIFHLLFYIAPSYGEVILEVEVRGNRNTDADLIQSTSGMREGEELTSEMAQNAIRRIYELGLFSEVSVESEEVKGGVKVILMVEEYPALSRLEFQGNKKISTKKFEKEIESNPGEILSPQRIFKWKKKIEEMYKKKGYLQAKVEEEVSEPNEDGRSEVVLRITEGQDVRIKRVVILGNSAFSDSKIESKMKNTHKRFLHKGKLNEKTLVDDLDKIVRFYQKNGYIDAKVKDHRIEYDETKKWLVIVIKVEEGPQYRLGEISIEGNQLFSEEKLIEKMKLKEGEVYNREKMDESLMEFYNLYTEEGYIYVNVNPSESAKSDVIDVHYQIVEGNPARVRKIEIEGNRTTREKVIRREIELMPGEVFKRSKVIRSQRDVFNLGYFEDVQLDSKTANEEGDIDLFLKVKEKPTGQIGAGMSISALDGLTGYISLTIPNLFGKGQKGNLLLERGGRKTNIRLGFTEPWFLDTPTSVGFDLFHLNRRRLEGFREKRTGGDLRLSREILQDVRAYWMYRLEDVELSVGENEENFIIEASNGLSSSSRITLVRDSRDNFFNATTGSRNSFSVENSGRFLGGDIHYQTYIAESRWFHPSFWKFIFSLRGKVGFVTDYIDPDAVPLFERFILGGIGTWGIRGYRDRSIFVREERLGGKDVPIKSRREGVDPNLYKIGGQTVRLGGKIALVLGAEHKFPIARNFYGLFFAEAGNTWEDIQSVRLKSLDDLKKGAGVGIRMEIPLMGVLGFDFGYGFDSSPERLGPGWEFHFQAGSAF